MSIELALAVVATVDICISRGSALVKKWETYRHATREIEERIVRFELSWLHVNDELDFLRRIAKHLDEKHLLVFKKSLDVLGFKLENAFTEIQKVVGATHKGLKYVLKKEGIDRALEDLQRWRKELEPAWYLIMLIQNPKIDIEVQATKSNSQTSPTNIAQSVRDVNQLGKQDKKPILLRESGLVKLQKVAIRFTDMLVASREQNPPDLVLERLQCPNDGEAARSAFIEDVQGLARKLTRAEPNTFRLLNCKGAVKHETSPFKIVDSLTLIFRFPEGCSTPRTLRECLLSRDPAHSLSERFRMANEIAQAINYIHLLGFVHRAIRPENILIFQDGRTQMGSLFVVGFEGFRTVQGHTRKLANSSWLEDLYRHPDRQGNDPSRYYIMQHDIYSLGVCLVEIGLWTSFAVYDFKDRKSEPASELQLISGAISERDSQAIKEGLLHIARTLLPPMMGTLYAQIAVTCLTCLDEGDTDFGNQQEFQDEDGVLVASRYIEKVLTQLNELKI